MKVELHIDELVLEGVPGYQRQQIASAIEQALARLVAEQGLPPGWQDGLSLPGLQVETDIEDEEQEEEISALQKEITEVNERVDQLPVMSIQQSLGRYRSHEKLEVGDVVASSLSRDDYVIKASRRASPIGVVAPRPDDFDENEYSVVLSGPVVCRVRGRVKAGDLLAPTRKPGMLEKASLWVRWFESDRIVARAIDNPTDPDDQFINVYFMPDLTMEED